MANIQTIGRILYPGRQYSHDIVRGMSTYAAADKRWAFRVIPPDAPIREFARDVGIDGIVAQVFSDPLRESLERAKLPVVNVSGALPHVPLPTVSPDNRAIGRLAAEHFLERGFRNFGFLRCLAHYSVMREQGFRDRLLAEGFTLTACPSEIVQRLASDNVGSRGAGNHPATLWTRSLPKPVAILAAVDTPGQLLVELCTRLDIAVPDEVAVLGVDNEEVEVSLCWPHLSSIDIGGAQIGFEAARMLDDMMNGRKPCAQRIVVPPVGVVTRGSTDVMAVGDRRVAQAVRLIRDHAHEDLSVLNVASHTGVNRRTLEMAFRRVLNRSVHDEIRRQRIALVKQLLTETDLPMTELACRTNHGNAQYMATVFRKATGITPSAYRRQRHCG